MSNSVPMMNAETINTTKDDAVRQAIHDVVQVWLQRLQLVSVITSFFASIDGLLFSLTSNNRSGPADAWSAMDKFSNATLAGALIFHVCAAFTSFAGSFILVRYQLLDADMHERSVSEDIGQVDDVQPTTKAFSFPTSSIFPVHPSSPALHDRQPSWSSASESILGRVAIRQVHLLPWSRRRHASRPTEAEKDSPSAGAHPSTDLDPPVKLLSRCHTLCVVMTGLGFVLAVTGILAYAWSSLPRSVSIFASACLAGCLSVVFLVLDI